MRALEARRTDRSWKPEPPLDGRHAYEFSDRRLGALYVGEKSLQQAQLVSEWGPVTLFLDGSDVDAAVVERLESRGIVIETGRVAELRGNGTALTSVELVGGRSVSIDALYLAPRTRLNIPVAEKLGCALEEGPVGTFLRTDASKATTVPGVYAAGDITRGAHTVAWAVADGEMAGMAAHRSLLGLD